MRKQASRLGLTMATALSLLSLLGGVLARPALADDQALATSLANAVASDPSQVTAASFVAKPPNGTPDAVGMSTLASFPTDGTSYGILTTGDASLAGTGPQSNFASADDSGGHRPNEGTQNPTDYDGTILRIDLNVPSGITCLSFDFRFLSEEYPQFVGSQFNDAFVAELDHNTWSTNGSTISAPDNFAFDPQHHVISINSTGVASMSAGEAAGTIYNGATTGLKALTPITSGSHSLYLSIFDQGDHIYDSAVFVDNLLLGTGSGSQCQKGVQPLANVTASANPATIAAGFSSIPMSGLNYGALAAPGGPGGNAFATAPIGHGPIGHGPIGHGPIGHGPIGHGPIIG
ncbi:MAG TPA: choice-of-anchor L domain-containing protein [Actinomycetota bacterium]|nr:choice-of-anchor L domain-containing protein [Actinomycetota bacterium]